MCGNRSRLKRAELNASDKEKEGRQARQDIWFYKLVQEHEAETWEVGGGMQLKNQSVPYVQPEGIMKVEGFLVNS